MFRFRTLLTKNIPIRWFSKGGKIENKQVLDFESFKRKTIPLDKNALKAEIENKTIEMEITQYQQVKRPSNEAPIISYKFDEDLGRVIAIRDPNFKKVPMIKTKEQLIQKVEALKIPNINIEGDKERVSKYLTRSSICSRRQAKKLIEEGIVLVNNKKVNEDTKIDPLVDEVKLFTKDGYSYPTKGSSRLWAFYKPRNIICTHNDPMNRVTIFDYLRDHKLIDLDHILTVVVIR